MSNRDKLIWTIVGLIVVLGGIYLIWRSNNSADQGNAKELSDIIRVETPEPGDELLSPVTIEGEARGNWFFEGSFPMHLVDSNGLEMAAGTVEADGDWMTEDFVPFTATLEFDTPTTATGTLLMMKDNPSGLQENDVVLRIPVKFDLSDQGSEEESTTTPETSPKPMTTTTGTVTTTLVKPTIPASPLVSVLSATIPVQIYFGDCNELQPVTRLISRTPAVARAALTELFRGPTPEERGRGIDTAIPDNVLINSLKIVQGLAMVDLSAELDSTVNSVCRAATVRSQIESTLRQFPSVTKVLITRDGQFTGVLQP
jgi:hypothetical protein